MSKGEIGPKPIKTEKKKVVDEPAQKPVKKSVEKRTRSDKWYHRQRAHVPGPRRRRKFAPRSEVSEAKEETGAVASAEAKVSDKGSSKKRSSKRDMTGREKPMTLGSIDG